MKFNKKNLYKKAIEVIDANNLFFIEDVAAFIPCSKTTFYKYIKVGTNEMNALSELLDKNRVVTKSAIRRKLYKSEKASELLALYRLVCSPEERQMLNQSYIELKEIKENKVSEAEAKNIVLSILNKSKYNGEENNGE